ncbi:MULTISPECIES: TonB-dependent receptor [unclassified Sphingobacterium]|uniref:SusC/RagA family TonB-linked outer membrane protein n=1 Tax=unclassified Sphingobacterium TaxID=2609468 RepID=UPI00104BF0E5|nr:MULTISPECIES: TonB-dependent receptor [unclassified Sphingobacterium]MCS3554583.1 TonB-linked SusC/RagA family outer membrane protein [Sphingobacterium sp. JUb21]TCR07573.1 TonB-linked SusC/RagA family outer membrane protein [Sphingobacterium sp. JUb20]
MKNKKILFLYVFMWLLPLLTYAQTKITGQLINKDKEPIVGASVLVEGMPNLITSTDYDGRFQLNDGKGFLLITYVGYKTQRVAIGNETKFFITLETSDQSLEEVVVVGYGTQSKRNITGAVSNIKSEDIVRSSSTTAAGALAGKVQGISVRGKDARPGRGAALEIRNMGNPLYVIDGIAYGGQTGTDWVGTQNGSGADIFNALNLEDIESISILKDAAAAVYGFRASGGVVLITTKKGNKGEKAKININGYQGWQNLTRFPDLANAAQYTRGLVEAAQNEGKDPNAVYTPDELAKWQMGTDPGYKSYDYYDMIIRKNIPQRNISANVTGGSDKSNYFLSIGHLTQDAMIKDFNYKRTNLQANMEARVLEGLTVGTQISGRHEGTQDVGLPGGDGYFSSILAMFKNRPTVSPYVNDNPDYPTHTNDFAYNPAVFDRDIAGYKDNRYLAGNVNLFASYKTKFGLSAKGTVSYNYTNNKFDGFQYTYDVYRFEDNEYKATGGSRSGWRYDTNRDIVSRFAQFLVDYNKQIGDHAFSGTLGYERSDWERTMKTLGANPSNNYIPLLRLSELNELGDNWDYQARAGYIGRLNYNYKGKYLLELLGRYDGSYLYYKDRRWGFFPGASLGWRISDENFFKPLKGVVNDLKIRASIGQTGLEEGVGMHGYLAGYNWASGDAVLDGNYVPGLQPRGLPVRKLSWVKNTNYNIGVDVGMLDNKLTMTADAFKIIRTGFPGKKYDVLLPVEIGYDLPNENLGKNGYYGAEGIITYTDKIGELNYVVSANLTYSRFKNLESYKPRFSNSWNEYRSSAEDRWGGVWWGYQVVGRFQSEDEIRNHPINNDGANNRTQLPGDFIYKDVNGDGVINGMDERPIGYPTGWAPIMSFGGRIGLNWKGIDMNVDFSGGAVQSWFQDYELRNAFHGGGNSPAYLLEDRWHRADPYDSNSEWIAGYYPALRNGNSGPNSRNSDFWLTNVRYLRIRNLELGYNFSTGLVKKIKAEKIRIYANGSNLFSFDNVKRFQIDPEIEAAAAVVYPQQRVFMVGFNVTF